MWYSVPQTNQGHRWYCASTQAMNLSLVGLVVAGTIYDYQNKPTALTATGTLTIAQLLTSIVTIISATEISMTLPTGTLAHAGMIGVPSSSLAINQGFEWSIMNLGSSSGAFTLVAGATHTTVGAMVVAIGTSSRFITRLSATNTAIAYRLCLKH
jgi:hypothetical protein